MVIGPHVHKRRALGVDPCRIGAQQTTSKQTLSRQAQVEAFASEEDLLRAFVDIVRALDPDIIIGYDVQKVTQHSAGYIFALGTCEV